MSKEIREQIDRLRNWNNFLNENILNKKVIIYPNFQGVDIADNVNTGDISNVNVNVCIGNEPNKNFDYFKNGCDKDKGPMKEYIGNIVKSVKEKGIESFPPVKAIKHPLLSGKYLVIDGNHRLGAFKIGNFQEIKMMVLSYNDIVLATPETIWQENTTPKTMTLEEAKEKNIDLKQYFNTKKLVIPKNDKWVNTMRKDMRDMIDKVKN
jgi:hypothetical protein